MRRKLYIDKMIGILAIILVLFMAAGHAEEEKKSGNYKYVLEDGGAIITGYVKEPRGTLKIPGKVGKYAVTGIGRDAFWGCYDVTKVTLPASVTRIQGNPFAMCNITSFTVALKNPVFESVDGVLFDKQRKMLVSYPRMKNVPHYTIPDGVLLIGESAFEYSGLVYNAVTIPESVTDIGDMAFYGCLHMTNMTIPESVTEIGGNAFRECQRLTLSVTQGSHAEEYAKFYGIPYEFAPQTDASGQWKYVPEDAGVAITGSVEEPSGNLILPRELGGYPVTSIGARAFLGCGGITGVVIPDSVTTIGDFAFTNCGGITSLVIPDSVTSMGYNVFQNCSGLTSVTLPDSVTSMGPHVFENCSGLTSVTLPDGITVIGGVAFRGCIRLAGIIIPEGITSIDIGTFAHCSGLSSVTLPAGVTSIGKDAFRECIRLTDVIIPEGCTSIGSLAFFHCGGLISVTLPASVTSIGILAFDGCDALTLSVQEGSFAEQYAKEKNIPYVIATE